MDELYKRLSFKQPEFLENPYGIRIYIGTKGEDDWAVEIPNKLSKAKSSAFKYDKNIVFYLVTEEYALELAERYTKIAKKLEGE